MGIIAPLDRLYEIANAYDILLMVDDAHGEGVLGKGGRGLVDHFNLHGKVDIEVGTFSKAFGVVGGVVSGNADVVEWLTQRGRPFLFSSAVTPPDVAACIAAIDLLEESTELVDTLWSNGAYFKKEMSALGFNIGNSQTPITPVMLAKHSLPGFQQTVVRTRHLCHFHRISDRSAGQSAHSRQISAAHSKGDLDKGLEGFKPSAKNWE
jgi:glycine C-acetyltransferase